MVVALIALGLLGFTFGTLLYLRHLQQSENTSQQEECPPWFAKKVWQDLNPTGFLERRMLLMGPTLIEPQFVDVTDGDRLRAPQGHTALPPNTLATTASDSIAALTKAHSQKKVRNAIWPLCCEAPCTLVANHLSTEELVEREGHHGPLDEAYLEEEARTWGASEGTSIWADLLNQVRRGEHEGIGINLFQCRGCQKIFMASCGPP